MGNRENFVEFVVIHKCDFMNGIDLTSSLRDPRLIEMG